MKTKITILCMTFLFAGFAAAGPAPRLMAKGRSGYVRATAEHPSTVVAPDRSQRPKTMALMTPKKEGHLRHLKVMGRAGFGRR